MTDRLGLQSPVLVGQSLGGHTAVLTAARHPGLVRALVLVEAGAGEPSPGTPADIGAWLDSWPVPFPSREAAVRFFGGGPVGEGWADGLEEREGGLWPRFDRDTMVASLAELARRSFAAEWSGVSCPTLLVRPGRASFPRGNRRTAAPPPRPDVRQRSRHRARPASGTARGPARADLAVPRRRAPAARCPELTVRQVCWDGAYTSASTPNVQATPSFAVRVLGGTRSQ